MESSRRDLFIDVVVDRFILESNQITLSPCITFIPKQVGDITGVSFYCAASGLEVLSVTMHPTLLVRKVV